MKRKIIPLLLILVMLSSIFGAGYAHDFITSSSSGFARGDGTLESPWEIETPGQLNNVRNYLGPDHADKRFKLVNDIDLGPYLSDGGAGYNSGAGWEPIGKTSGFPDTTRFYGTFDGNGHSISNLMINRPFQSFIGLFGETNEATITGVSLLNVDVKGDTNVGGLVGYKYGENLSNGYIINSSVSGNVSGNFGVGILVGGTTYSSISDSFAVGSATPSGTAINEQFGGLVGALHHSTIINSYAKANVGGFRAIGGLVGIINTSTIENSYAVGEVTATSDYKGGLVGEQGGSLTITNSYHQGPDNGFGEFRTAADMTHPHNEDTTYIDWDLVNTWDIREDVNEGYPFLQWQQMDEPGDFAGGSGTAADPYQIATADQLNNVRNYLDKHFILVNDIDLSAYGSSYDGDNGWLPIGDATSSPDNTFQGFFNGNGYTIEYLYINRNDDIGLFGAIYGASIENVKLHGVEITGSNYVGGLVGYSVNATITNSYVTGTVQGYDYVGGLVGNSNTITITKSYVSGTVQGRTSVGGLVGRSTNINISNSYTDAYVSGNNEVGGLVGINNGGNITYTYATGAVNGSVDVGGLVGSNSGTVDYSYYDSQTTGQDDDTGKGVPKTTAEMKQQVTFVGWDFTATWAIIEHETYPYLQWQQMAEPGNFAGGAGTVEDPYQIATADQLNNVRNYLHGHFIMVNDIDLTVYGASHDGGKGWLPIGDVTNSPDNTFQGSFNGNGYTISNLYINRPDEDRIGLFGYVIEADITGVKLLGVNVRGNERVGGLVGRIHSGTISDSSVTGTVDGNNFVGGLVGELENSNISKSCAMGTVIGRNYNSSYIGGLVGYSINSNITESYATGNSTTGNSGFDVGGLVGRIHSGTISDSYATGAVHGCGHVGGFVGAIWAGTITNNYATGAVNGTNDTVGGLVGANYETVIASYYDSQTTGQDDDTGKGVPKTTAQMKQQSTFSVWNFTNTWAIFEGVTYPYLQWQQMAEPGDFAGGSGTIGDPYRIATADQLNNVRNYLDKHFILVNDIDLSDYGESYDDGKGWLPIGSISSSFTGNLDGDGYTINNLYINRTGLSSLGLFGETNGVTIKNINLAGVNIDGYMWVGGLVGTATNTNIANSHVTGEVKGTSYVGGLVGLSANSTITNSYAAAEVSGNGYVGGMAGNMFMGTIRDSSATGTVTSAVGYSGGLVGDNNQGTIIDSWAAGTVTEASNFSGGLVGSNSSGTIAGCYATASVEGSSTLGGLVGRNTGNIENSYATGTVSGDDEVGGLVGRNNSTGNITYTYATGNVSRFNAFGGLVGAGDGNITASYSLGPDNGLGEVKTEDDMKQKVTFTDAGWNFDDIWAIQSELNYGYPFLRWQNDIEPTYTVTYDANTGDNPPTDGETYNVGDEVTVLDIGDMTREGFTFVEWNTASDDTGDSYDPGDTFIMPAADVILYAQWEVIGYTVTFDLAEYGTRTGGGELVQTVNHGDDAEAPIFDVEEGWHFTDWDTGFTNVTSDLTVTAQYSRDTYTVTFDSQEGSAVDPQTVAHGQTALEPDAPTRDGYTFEGWYTEDTFGTAWDFDDPITGDLTLYARWTALPIDCTPETAWAAGDRYVSGRGPNWATYTSYSGNTTVTLYAGQHMDAGTVHFSASESGKVIITISLSDGWRFEDAEENIKIQDYSRRPRGNPKPDRFDFKFTASGSQHSLEIPQNSYYGVNVNVCKPVTAYSTFEQQADILAEAKNDRLEDADNDELVGDEDVAKGDITIKTEDAKADDDLDHDSGLDNGTIANSSDCCDDNETDDKNAVTSVKDNDDVDGNDENGADLPENNSKTQTLDEVTYTLDLVIVGKGTVVSEEELEVLNEYEADSEVELTAVPAEGWDFEKWVIDEVEEFDATINIIIKEDLEVTAVFVLKAEPESEPEPEPDLEVIPDLEAVNEEKEDNHRPDNPGSQGKGRK